MRIKSKPQGVTKPFIEKEATETPALAGVIDVSQPTGQQTTDFNEKLKKLFGYLDPTDNGLVVKGTLKSSNFVRKLKGWGISVNKEGDSFFKDIFATGTFEIGGATKTIDSVAVIQSSLDEVDADGGGIVYLKAGTYLLTSDITIPSGVLLEGVTRDGVIIDCNTSYAVKIAGTDVYATGTVTINNGETEVVGSNTVWTAAMVGRYIQLDGLWYEITARTDNTHITIDTYQGANLSASAYVLADTNFNASLKKVTVTNATGAGIVVQYAMEPNLLDIVVYGCGTGIDMDYVTFPRLLVTSNENGVNLNMNFVTGFYIDYCEFNLSTTGAGVVMTDSDNATFFNTSVNDNTGDGINATNCSKIAFISFDISGNGGQGIEFVSGCNDNSIGYGVLDGNTSDNIKLTATSDRNVITATSIKNAGGYGINIAASTCDNNIIRGNTYDSNTSGKYNDSGTDSKTDADFEKTRTFTAGMAITADQAVFIHTDGKVYSADASLSGAYESFIGFATETVAKDATISIWTIGSYEDLSGLTIGSIYYLQDATHTLDQQNTTGASDSTLNSGTEYWQSFTTGASVTHLSKFQIYAGGGSTTFTVRIRVGQGTGGAILYTTTISTDVSYSWEEVILAVPVTLSPSTQYSITVEAAASVASWTFGAGNPYAGGRSDASADQDRLFKTFYTPDRGAIGTSAGSNSKKAGLALSTTELQINYAL